MIVAVMRKGVMEGRGRGGVVGDHFCGERVWEVMGGSLALDGTFKRGILVQW
jgi:hypothetical protein